MMKSNYTISPNEDKKERLKSATTSVSMSLK